MISRLRSFLKTRHGQLGALLALTSLMASLLAALGWVDWAVAGLGLVLSLTVLLVVDLHKKTRIQLAGNRQLGADLRGVRSDWQRTNDAVAAATNRLELSLRDSTSDLRVLREQVLVRLDLIERTLEHVGETIESAGHANERDWQRTNDAVAAATNRLEHVGETIESAGHANERGFTQLSRLHDTSQAWLVEAEHRQQEHVRVTSARLVAELDAARQVHRRLPLPGPEPLLSDWALSPRGLLDVLNAIELRRPRLVVECGSGASTVYIAALLEQLGDGGSLVSLEHLAEHAEATSAALEANRLSHVAEVRLAPLAETVIDGKAYNWYSVEAVVDLTDIDLTLVDGPPRATGRHARFPALSVLAGRMSPNATILLDDAQRDDERWVLRRWESDHPVERLRGLTPDMAILRLDRPADQGER